MAQQEFKTKKHSSNQIKSRHDKKDVSPLTMSSKNLKKKEFDDFFNPLVLLFLSK